jgi:3D (Asp-Asp-Asp) domain-containing protein
VKREHIGMALLAGLLVFNLCVAVTIVLRLYAAPAPEEPEVLPEPETCQAVMETPPTVEVDKPVVVVPEEPEVLPGPGPETPAEPTMVSLGSFKVTHYCPCKKCCGKDPDHPAYGITASGTVATAGRTIAVDPDVIPYGTEVLVRYEDGTEHVYIAEDCGGAIDGNRLDVFMDSHQDAWNAGIKTAEVFIYD